MEATNKPWQFKPKQVAWNKGTGGCKRGHDPALYVPMPGTGIYVCLGCKRENGARYRKQNRKQINLKNRVGRYKISIEEYERLMQVQGGHCAICGADLSKTNVRIDHNHVTGAVRGLLCAACNTGIGLLKDSPDVLEKARNYLRDANAND